ncbi:MAG: cytochrome c biogenesis protein CcsA [Myxococcales bacterium]|nr:cytochrome c biogenesis protein CcsA [Myxococcales bacterium]
MTLYAAAWCVLSGIAAGVLVRRPATGPRSPATLVVAIGALVGLTLLVALHPIMPFGAGRTLAFGLAAGATALAVRNAPVAAALLTAAGVAALGSLPTSSTDPVALSATGTPWSLLHVLLGIASTAATAVAAAYAALALRRSPTALVVMALVLTALPLVSRAGDLVLHTDGAPALLDIPVLDPDGAQGLVRRVTLTAGHRAEWLLRALASAGLVVLLFTSLRSRTAGSPLRRGLARLSLALLLVHGAVYLVYSLPLEVAVEPTQLVARLLLGELQGTEALPRLTLPALTGGVHAAGFPLLFAMIALCFTWLATARLVAPPSDGSDSARSTDATRAIDTPDDRHTERAAYLAAALLGATVLTGVGWSNYVWGGFLVPDPKLFAGVVSLGLYVMFLWTRATLPRWGSARATFVLVAALVTFWSLVGPPLGLVSPSLHDFGR